MVICCSCDSKVDRTAKALCMKLIDPETKRFYCINCLSDYLEVDAGELLDMAEEFKNSGCTLFQ